ncbi:MAG: hypothetical protein V3V11_03080, partial [Vicinamibacteria bacterium]
MTEKLEAYFDTLEELSTEELDRSAEQLVYTFERTCRETSFGMCREDQARGGSVSPRSQTEARLRAVDPTATVPPAGEQARSTVRGGGTQAAEELTQHSRACASPEFQLQVL